MTAIGRFPTVGLGVQATGVLNSGTYAAYSVTVGRRSEVAAVQTVEIEVF